MEYEVHVDVPVNAVAVQVETVDHKVGQEDDVLEAVELPAGLAGAGGWGREDGGRRREGWRIEDGGWRMEDYHCYFLGLRKRSCNFSSNLK